MTLHCADNAYSQSLTPQTHTGIVHKDVQSPIGVLNVLSSASHGVRISDVKLQKVNVLHAKLLGCFVPENPEGTVLALLRP